VLKSPVFVVMSGADGDDAAAAAIVTMLINAGADCSAFDANVRT
jgi:acyl-CoA reductase-like NAD-dependent aldehyde dehydrogenase